jgi:hypothetical protein
VVEKAYNKQYSDIEICEENLLWIKNGTEQQLDATVCQETFDPNLLSKANDEDLGPCSQKLEEKIDDTEPVVWNLTYINRKKKTKQ